MFFSPFVGPVAISWNCFFLLTGFTCIGFVFLFFCCAEKFSSAKNILAGFYRLSNLMLGCFKKNNFYFSLRFFSLLHFYHSVCWNFFNFSYGLVASFCVIHFVRSSCIASDGKLSFASGFHAVPMDISSQIYEFSFESRIRLF